MLYPDADSDIFWNERMAANYPQKKTDMLMAKQIIKAVKIKNVQISDQEIKRAIADIIKEISSNENDLPVGNYKRNFFKRTSFELIAASILLVFSIAALYNLTSVNNPSIVYKELVKEAEGKLVEKVNSGSGLMEIKLEDGSKITLKKNARISFPVSFKGLVNRKVYLTGEAFFEVEKDSEKPFFVYANGLITKVLGTKFKIRSNNGDKNASVEVTSGVVAVFSLVDKESQDDLKTKKLNSVILTRNQKANYSSVDRTLMTSVVEQPVAVNDKIFDYTFSDTPIKEIFKKMVDGYGIEIIYDEKILAERTFSADLSKTTMYEKLNIICKAINSWYEIIDGKIVVYANTLSTKDSTI